MSTLIRWLHDVEHDQVSLVGGKGANLGRLLQMGLPVPAGFVVTTAAYRTFLAANGLSESTGTGPETLPARILDAPIPAEISAPILDAYRQLSVPAVAVRSSGTAEDLADASFAGQHDTFLDVAGPEAVLAAVRACWASLWSPRAVEYRRRQGVDGRGVAMAVIVQAMVPAEWAGVLFTADPVTGQRDRMIVEAVAGLGEALVSGEVSGTRYVVEKATLRILAGATPASAGESAPDGVPHPVIEEVARLGLQIEAAFGQPQDVEWASAGGRCALLQARPLTTLPIGPAASASPTGLAGPAGPGVTGQPVARRPRHYSRAQRANAPNMLDHIPLPPYPFDDSLFFRPGMQRVQHAVRALGFAARPLEDTFIEVADGVVQVVPPDFRPTLRALALPAKLLRALRASPDGWLDECRRTLVTPAQQIDGEEVATLSEQDLLERIELLQRRQVALFVPRFGYFPRGMLISQGLSLLLRLAAGRAAAPRLEAGLLAGIPCATTAANQALGRLARLIRASEDLRQAFLAEPPEQVPIRLSESAAGRAVLAELDTFLQRYGYRETAMPAAALPAWRDDLTVVYGLLKGLVAGGRSEGAAEPGSSRASAALTPPPRRSVDGGGEAEPGLSVLDADDGGRAERARREVVAALSRGWFGLRRRLLLPLFLQTLAAARDFIAFREDSHFYLFMPFPVIRRLALELGRHLVARGALDEPGDIFFLEIEEIKRPGPAAALREKAQRRRRARHAVEGRYTSVPADLLTPAAVTATGEVRGVPVSPGQAVGRVRVILREQEFGQLQPGEVLVARYTNPAWTPLFAVAAAVVVDAGGTASHAAIVAREYGLPAVMGAGNATARLRDGQRVLVDGSTGRVVPVGEHGGR